MLFISALGINPFSVFSIQWAQTLQNWHLCHIQIKSHLFLHLFPPYLIFASIVGIVPEKPSYWVGLFRCRESRRQAGQKTCIFAGGHADLKQSFHTSGSPTFSVSSLVNLFVCITPEIGHPLSAMRCFIFI